MSLQLLTVARVTVTVEYVASVTLARVTLPGSVGRTYVAVGITGCEYSKGRNRQEMVCQRLAQIVHAANDLITFTYISILSRYFEGLLEMVSDIR